MAMKKILSLYAVLMFGAVSVQAAETKSDATAVGYGGAYVQLKPLMVPTWASNGAVTYEAVTLRLVLDAGERERVACFSAPIVHEKFLMYFYNAKLTTADFIGKRKDVLEKTLLDVAINSTAKNYYSAVKIVDQSQLQLEAKIAASGKPKAAGTPEEQMENKSKTMTNQCQ
jgi:hypothetical protein